METVGRVYGWQILIMEKMITFYVVYTTYYCYLLLSGLAIIFHPMCVLNNVLWTTVFLIYGVLILFSCDEANKKAQSVLLLSRNLIRRTKPKTQIRRVLQQFSSQMSQVKPQFCCPLGFPICRKSFFNIIGRVVDYLIIVFQLDT
ncbi:unnamed protein product [Tenebrio molitor]|nr:unnamed protein product [Tenebrio molitor]